jgi:hypothetical protein
MKPKLFVLIISLLVVQ